MGIVLAETLFQVLLNRYSITGDRISGPETFKTTEMVDKEISLEHKEVGKIDNEGQLHGELNRGTSRQQSRALVQIMEK